MCEWARARACVNGVKGWSELSRERVCASLSDSEVIQNMHAYKPKQLHSCKAFWLAVAGQKNCVQRKWSWYWFVMEKWKWALAHSEKCGRNSNECEHSLKEFWGRTTVGGCVCVWVKEWNETRKRESSEIKCKCRMKWTSPSLRRGWLECTENGHELVQSSGGRKIRGERLEKVLNGQHAHSTFTLKWILIYVDASGSAKSACKQTTKCMKANS